MLNEHDKLLFRGASDFSQFIEEAAVENKQSYIDTILTYCKENFIDPEEIKSLVSNSLRDKLEVEFQELRMLPKSSSLF